MILKLDGARGALQVRLGPAAAQGAPAMSPTSPALWTLCQVL
jgi:hypothetical protein